MDTNRLLDYMPKAKDYYDKLKAAEKKMVSEADKEKAQLKSMIKSKSVIIDETKRNLHAK